MNTYDQQGDVGYYCHPEDNSREFKRLTGEDRQDFRPPARRMRADQHERAADAVKQALAMQNANRPDDEQPEENKPGMPRDIAANAVRFAEMVAELQTSERDMREKNNQARARLEQTDRRVLELTAERDHLRATLDEEKQKRMYLHAIITNIGGLVSDAVTGDK